MTKIIAISNHKGGVGKTTSTVNIGSALALRGKRVLLVDLDPQANLSQSLGVKNPKITIYDNLRGNKSINIETIKDNLSLIPSSLDLSAAEFELNSEPGREYILGSILKNISNNFDYIIIDCPPSLGLLTVNALTASDQIIIPLQAEYLPLSGLERLNDIIEKVKDRLNPKLEIGGVLLTQYDPRKILNRDIAENVKEFFGEKLFKTTISSNIALAEAPSQGQDIFSYNESCKGASDYNDLCDELFEKGVA